jgi:hypothetical protein
LGLRCTVSELEWRFETDDLGMFGYSSEKPPPAYGAAEMTNGDRIDPTNPVRGQRGATDSLSGRARSGAAVDALVGLAIPSDQAGCMQIQFASVCPRHDIGDP